MTLDGEDVSSVCCMADDVLGEVELVVLRDGQLQLNTSCDRFLTTIRSGVVIIERTPL